MKNHVSKLIAISTAILLCSAAPTAQAATESVVADVEFVAVIGLTEVNTLNFGLVDTAFVTSETLTIATNDTVGGTTARSLGGTTEAAEITVTATASQSINILIDTIVDGTYYTLDTFLCDYNGGGSTACSASSMNTTSAASAPLLIGAKITHSGNPSAGADDGSFVVNVIYN